MILGGVKIKNESLVAFVLFLVVSIPFYVTDVFAEEENVEVKYVNSEVLETGKFGRIKPLSFNPDNTINTETSLSPLTFLAITGLVILLSINIKAIILLSILMLPIVSKSVKAVLNGIAAGSFKVKGSQTDVVGYANTAEGLTFTARLGIIGDTNITPNQLKLYDENRLINQNFTCIPQTGNEFVCNLQNVPSYCPKEDFTLVLYNDTGSIIGPTRTTSVLCDIESPSFSVSLDKSLYGADDIVNISYSLTDTACTGYSFCPNKCSGFKSIRITWFGYSSTTLFLPGSGYPNYWSGYPNYCSDSGSILIPAASFVLGASDRVILTITASDNVNNQKIVEKEFFITKPVINSVKCWGGNAYGQSYGYNGSDAVQVSAGLYHTCILKSDGNVDCFGNNYYGQSEDYTAGDAIRVSSGAYHTCILKSNGNVSCWGDDTYGQSSDYNGSDAVQVSTGKYHTCILKSNGNVYCWGDTYNSYAHTCTLISGGNVDCYGDNTYGQASDYNGGDAVQVSTGAYHTCILKSNGDVDCWGANTYGQCETSGITNMSYISSGGYHTCAILDVGEIPLSYLNLISIPLVQDNNSVQNTFSSIQGKYETIYAYEPSRNYWRSYNIDRPYSLNTLTTITPEKGYWINLKENALLVVKGRLPSSVNYNLKQGWNLIGYPSLTTQNITIALEHVAGTYTSIFSFINGTWSSYSPERPINTLQTMKPGYGYWVKANQDTAWLFNGSYYLKY